MKYRIITILLMVLIANNSFASKPIKAVILTGQCNHNWVVSHVAIKQILENSGLFDVDLAISPKKGEDMSNFTVNFENYDVVILDYTGDAWSETVNKDFIEYVKNGGGIVVYHAANNAFPDWKEYNEITALGGWRGRNEKSGPWVYYKDGALIKDYAPGKGGGHGKRRDFALTCRNKKHPITKGLPEIWMHKNDELYHLMRGPGNIKDLLYTAYADPSTKGSGREEPLIFTVDFGKGRIFHTMLGHAGFRANDYDPMHSTGFQVTLLRGAEWAATGKVKQKIPKDFPTKTKYTLRPQYKKIDN